MIKRCGCFVACDDLRQIQVLARQSDDELRQMVRRHIIDERRWQKLCLINFPRTKMSAHDLNGIRFVPKTPRLLGHAPSGFIPSSTMTFQGIGQAAIRADLVV